MHNFFQHSWAFIAGMVVLFLLNACQSNIPEGVLSESKMEKVLYDYHLAKAMAAEASADSSDYYAVQYEQAVLVKYGIDKDTFTRSMEWYARHTERLNKIYSRIAERMGDDAGATSVGMIAMGEAKGDTLNIWHGPQFVLLNTQIFNRFTFEEKADTSFHAGDVLQWQFSVEWYYSEGTRDAVALLAVYYEGDSVATVSQSVFTQGEQRIRMNIGPRSVEKICGVIYQKGGWSERPRILTLFRPALLRIRQKAVLPLPGQPIGERNDSVAVSPHTSRQRLRDSLLNEERAREEQPHFQ